MKTAPGLTRTAQGHTLLVALFTLLIIGMALLTYLQLQTNANQLVVRSQVWNACMPVLEAGIAAWETTTAPPFCSMTFL